MDIEFKNGAICLNVPKGYRSIQQMQLSQVVRSYAALIPPQGCTYAELAQAIREKQPYGVWQIKRDAIRTLTNAAARTC